ncbi:molybdopterin converting factor subunit 1 [Ureibacillus thermophilus]|uniref:Molybdopterin synthase sulfur carrier subunit n=1 Tax=Ureibacillus thermophilus TaxID=367743 RepID=A0A4P6UX46_9BACL|nr:molybdopterin converting factor subunit 1 [Ureibacillus thermophilus]QBK26866.1 molybdopterin converting factor subunit 1 [Ureibacillus thermophilus]
MIKVLLFAHLQEAVGQSKVMVELEGCTVQDVKKWMEKEYPQLSLEQMMAAVNEEFVTDDAFVKDGDTLAFIPPISGG